MDRILCVRRSVHGCVTSLGRRSANIPSSAKLGSVSVAVIVVERYDLLLVYRSLPNERPALRSAYASTDNSAPVVGEGDTVKVRAVTKGVVAIMTQELHDGKREVG